MATRLRRRDLEATARASEIALCARVEVVVFLEAVAGGVVEGVEAYGVCEGECGEEGEGEERVLHFGCHDGGGVCWLGVVGVLFVLRKDGKGVGCRQVFVLYEEVETILGLTWKG